MDVELLDRVLLVSAAVLVLAILAVRLTATTGLPTLLTYLVIGVLLGAAGVEFGDPGTAHALGFAALVVILAEGGLTTRWSDVRSAMPLGVLLATVGIAVATAVVATAVHLLFGQHWTTALIIGGIFAATDSAAVFSVLRRVPLVSRVSGALEAESGLNDAPTVLLVTLLSTGAVAEAGPIEFGLTVFYELGVGSAVGLGLGFLAAAVLRRLALPASGLYPLGVFTGTVLAYGAASGLHASGFAAVYLAALVLGNADLAHGPATRSFVEGLAWLAQIGLFVMLGLLAWPLTLTWDLVGQALVVGLVSTLLARPLSVVVCALPFQLSWAERGFLSVAGLRGAVPVVLATIPLAAGYPGSDDVFTLVFIAVIVFTLAQTPPLPRLARFFGVVQVNEPRDLDIEAAPLARLDADLLQVSVAPDSMLHGVEIAELRLPPEVSVSLVLRDGASLVPGPTTALRHGDDLLVVVPRAQRARTEERLRQISRQGRLAAWLAAPDLPKPNASEIPLRWTWPAGARLRALLRRRGRGSRGTPGTEERSAG